MDFRSTDNRTQRGIAMMRRSITRAEAAGLLLLIAGVFLLGNGKTADIANRVASVEASTHQSAAESCKVQVVGLEAQSYLTTILSDARTLFTLTPSSTSKQQTQLPAAEAKILASTLKSMNDSIFNYVWIEKKNKHAKSRSCS